LFVCPSSLWRPDGRRGLQTVGPWRVCEGRQLAPIRGQHRQQLCECCPRKLSNWSPRVNACDHKCYTGFMRSWKTWKIHIFKSLSGLKKSLRKIQSQKFGKSHGNVFYSHADLRGLIKRIHIYINFLNQTIVSFICVIYTPRFHQMFGHGNVV